MDFTVEDEVVTPSAEERKRKRKSREFVVEHAETKGSPDGQDSVSKKRKSEPTISKASAGNTKPGDWACPGCQFSNFASRATCKLCHADKPLNAGARESDWTCSCGFSNFDSRQTCKDCGKPKSDSVVEHRVGLSHLKWTVTEEQIKEFFLPLVTQQVKLLYRDGKPQGKANVLFNSHDDAVEAMKKDQMEIAGMAVNLYLKSTDTSRSAARQANPAQRKGDGARPGDWSCHKCSFANFAFRARCKHCDAGSTSNAGGGVKPQKEGDWVCVKCSFNNFKSRDKCMKCRRSKPVWVAPALGSAEASGPEDTMNDTAELDESTNSEGGKTAQFQWFKMIKSCLKTAEDKKMSFEKLEEVLLPFYTEVGHRECSKEQFRERLEKRLKRSQKLTYIDGMVSL